MSKKEKLKEILDKRGYYNTDVESEILDLFNVGSMFPKLETVNKEVEKYNENTGLQGDKGHFQNGINWAFNYISKQTKE